MATEDPLAALSDEEKSALAELAQRRVNGGLDRRTLLEAAGYTGIGALIGGGSAFAATQPAAADAVGEEGTSADPLVKLWTHAIESGDGASQINIPDTVGIDSASIDSISRKSANFTDDVTLAFLQALNDDSLGLAGLLVEVASVSTSAETILDTQGAVGQVAGIAGVVGASGSKSFSEVVHFSSVGNTTTLLGTAHEDGTPDGRTYTVSSGDLQLAMASGTYNVTAVGLAFNTDT